jgi:hypothetical protein
MFNKTIRREIAKFIAEGGINTENVVLVKNENLANQREYNADNNKEIKMLKMVVGALADRLLAMETFLGVEFDPGMEEVACEDCGEVAAEAVEPSYSKVKKAKRGNK